MDYILKHSILSEYGSAYTLSNLEDESYLELTYSQICMAAQNRALKMKQSKADFYSKEGIEIEC